MNKFLSAVCLGLAVMVAGCGTAGFPVGSVPAVVASTLDEKALVGLEASAIAANEFAQAAVRSGVLTPGSDNAVKVADYLVRVRQGVVLARQAYAAGNASDYQSQVLATLALIGQIKSITG